MRIVEIPSDLSISFSGPQGKVSEKWTFKGFLIHQLDTFDGIETRAQVRQAEKIIRLIDASTGTIPFEDEDYKVVDDACAKLRFVPEVKRQMLPFLDAFEKPQDVKK